MKKNTGSQVVGAQMVSASDGSAFTGSVTVSVTGDAGTQATGSVGSGACTHEGNGFHTYAPAQAETNYDHVAFTFTGTGAVPATVQIYTSFPQTGDNYARLGAPAGASVSADVAAIKAETASILTDTAEIGAAGAGLTALASQASVNTIDDFLDTEVAAILADTNELQTDWANGGRLDLILDARASQTSVDDLPTNAELATALGTADDAVLAQVALVKAVTDKVDTTLESTGSPGQYVFTDEALAQAPSGTGASATAIADEVQTRTIAAVTTVNGLAANTVTAAALAADAVAEIQSGLATSANVTAAWTTALTEAYAADGATMTPAQALYMIWSLLAERSIASTTLTAKKLDGSTTAMTFTLDSATTPTSQTRAT